MSDLERGQTVDVDTWTLAEHAERERVRKLALEPSEEMVERLGTAMTEGTTPVDDGIAHLVHAVLRAFAEEIGR